MSNQDLELERNVLGLILVNGKLDLELEPEDFVFLPHRKILDAIRKVSGLGLSPDMLTVTESLRQDGELEAVGGPEYIANLTDKVPMLRGVNRQYLGMLRERAGMRALGQFGGQLTLQAQNGAAIREVIAQAYERLNSISRRSEAVTSGPRHVKELIDEHIEELQAIGRHETGGISVGLKDLDSLLLGGLRKGTHTVVAGRPGMGKTALLLNIAATMAKDLRVVMFSLEMAVGQLLTRLLSMFSNVIMAAMLTGYVPDRQWVAVDAAAKQLKAMNLWIDDTADLAVGDVRSRMARIEAVDVVIIDYLQLLAHREGKRLNENERVSQISMALKALAKDSQVALISAAALSRASEKRTGGQPKLSDLRSSGQIESDADCVILLTREEGSEITEAIVAKQRQGPTGVVSVAFFASYSRFLDAVRNDGAIP